MGVPGSRDWSLADDDPRNACLDGFNQLPGESELPGFRSTVVRYFEACAELSHRIATLMQAGILGGNNGNHQSNGGGGEADENNDGIHIVGDLKRHHTSYLRVNYYPVYDPPPEGEEDAPDVSLSSANPAPLGISPHRDAGFLTVLLQDENCHSLQVVDKNGEWRTVTPVPGSLTINTGVVSIVYHFRDSCHKCENVLLLTFFSLYVQMAQIWSNGRYRAPLHRVLTNAASVRYSAPFFYNPGYDSYIRPVIQNNGSGENASSMPRYHPCLWGYFRAVRFAGDLTDLGVEIQEEDFEIDGSNASTGKDKRSDGDNSQAADGARNKHLERQARFVKLARYDQPFSVEAFRDLLIG